jgi:hypothetical protein
MCLLIVLFKGDYDMASVHGAGGGHTLFPSAGHEQIAGGAQSGSGPLGLASATSGFDTVTGPGQGSGGFAGAGGSAQVVASQTQAGANVQVHLQDGSTITVVGVTHIDASFFH